MGSDSLGPIRSVDSREGDEAADSGGYCRTAGSAGCCRTAASMEEDTSDMSNRTKEVAGTPSVAEESTGRTVVGLDEVGGF